MTLKQKPRRQKLHQFAPSPADSERPYLWGVVTVLIVILIASVGTHFIDKLHYDNVVSQIQVSYTNLQSTEIQERNDLGFVIKNSSATLMRKLYAKLTT
jgi:hypothetical protein